MYKSRGIFVVLYQTYYVYSEHACTAYKWTNARTLAHTHPLQTPVEDPEVRVGWTQPCSHPHLILFLLLLLVEGVFIGRGLTLGGLGRARYSPAIASWPQLLHPGEETAHSQLSQWRARANKLNLHVHPPYLVQNVWSTLHCHHTHLFDLVTYGVACMYVCMQVADSEVCAQSILDHTCLRISVC